ncbi:response regulator [Litorivivens sp.]|uniref:response regulator n=1 Tax=Litorivivens sp. TaxID=2020868 RepID=UPI003569E1DA
MTSEKLLLADDSLPSLFATKAMLEKLGYHVTTAENGDKALALACEAVYDLILLDEHLPGKRGSEVAQYLRQNQTINSDTYLISITGESDIREKSKILAAGINQLIEKPVSLKKLQGVLKSNSAVLDKQTIDTLTDDLGHETARRLLALFEKELSDLSTRLDEADDLVAETLAASHILKNSATLYGALELAEVARELNENTDLTTENATSAAQRLLALCQSTADGVRQILATEASE